MNWTLIKRIVASRIVFLLAAIGFMVLLSLRGNSDFVRGDFSNFHYKEVRQSNEEPAASSSSTQKTGDNGQVKVLLVAYMRGGSTFTSELFNQNNNASFFYEPLDSIYGDMYAIGRGVKPLDIHYYHEGSYRVIPKYEEDYLIEKLKSLYECDMRKMPTLFYSYLHSFGPLRHKRLNKHLVCVQSALKKDGMNECSKTGPKEYLFGAKGIPCKSTFKLGDDTNKMCFDKHRDWQKEIESLPKYAAKPGGKDIRWRQVLDIDLEDNPNITITPNEDWYMKKRLRCIHQFREVAENSSCINMVDDMCKSSNIVAAKVIRLRADTIVRIMNEMPDLKLIYVVRDPRGIIASRKKANVLSSSSHAKINDETDHLCRKISSDVAVMGSLKEMFPERILFISYEFAATNPKEVTENVYSFLGSKAPFEVLSWLADGDSSGGRHKADNFNTFRENFTETAYGWKEYMSQENRTFVETACGDLIKDLGYNLKD